MAAYNQDNADKFIASYKALSNSGNKNEFSVTPCPCCGSRLYGERHEFTCLTETGEIETEWLCVDCLFYIELGQLPD